MTISWDKCLPSLGLSSCSREYMLHLDFSKSRQPQVRVGRQPIGCDV